MFKTVTALKLSGDVTDTRTQTIMSDREVVILHTASTGSVREITIVTMVSDSTLSWELTWPTATRPRPSSTGPALTPGLAQISGDPVWLTQGTFPPPPPSYLREALKKKNIFLWPMSPLLCPPPPLVWRKTFCLFWSKMAFSWSENFLLQPCHNLSISTVNKLDSH